MRHEYSTLIIELFNEERKLQKIIVEPINSYPPKHLKYLYYLAVDMTSQYVVDGYEMVRVSLSYLSDDVDFIKVIWRK